MPQSQKRKCIGRRRNRRSVERSGVCDGQKQVYEPAVRGESGGCWWRNRNIRRKSRVSGSTKGRGGRFRVCVGRGRIVESFVAGGGSLHGWRHKDDSPCIRLKRDRVLV